MYARNTSLLRLYIRNMILGDAGSSGRRLRAERTETMGGEQRCPWGGQPQLSTTSGGAIRPLSLPGSMPPDGRRDWEEPVAKLSVWF
jgi:hypothetical protein